MNTPLTKHILGIDIGGTGIKAGVVDTNVGTLSTEIITRPTQPSTPENVATVIAEIVREFNWHGPIGCGYPGVIINGVAMTAVHLSKDWLNRNVSHTINARVNLPVTVLNDADAAGLAELRFGAGRVFQSRGVVLMLTLGTGIGSALFVSGRLVPNTEFGHVYIEGVEAEAIAAASRRVAENLSWEVWGGRVKRVLAEMEKLLSPELIILGGGVSENFDKFAPYLHTRAKLVKATLGNDAGIIGAALAATEPIA